jgi:hypothetical protein
MKLLQLLVLSAFLFPGSIFGQCENDLLLDKCASNLGTYNYIRSYEVKDYPRRKANSEFSYVFSKGSTYIMLPCTENSTSGKMIISIYDRDHKLLASTYDENIQKYYADLQYPCSVTGLYYIRATFKDTKRGYGTCILGFNRDK